MAKLTGADGGESPEEIFTSYYHKNFWGDDQSRSGPGSNDVETHVIRERLPGLLKEMGATSILDIPCGDFDWMRKVDLGDVSYLGADIVQPLIDRNIAMFGSPRIAFVKLDLIEDRLPRRDVVLCRDCLFHLSLTDGVKALANIRKSGARYLMATTHPSNLSNSDSRNGGYRPLDLTKWPFDLPAPHELIPERPHADHADRNKSIGIWKLNDIGA